MKQNSNHIVGIYSIVYMRVVGKGNPFDAYGFHLLYTFAGRTT